MIPLKFQINCVTFLLKSRQWLFISFNLKTNSLTIDCKALCPFLLCPLFQFSHADQFCFPQRVQEYSCLRTFALFSLPVLLFLKTFAPIAHSISLIQSFLFCVPSVATLWKESMPPISTFLLLCLFSLALIRILYITHEQLSFLFSIFSSSLNSKLHYT